MIKIKKYNFLFFSFLFIHIFRLGALAAIPAAIFYLLSGVNQIFKFKASFYIFIYVLYCALVFISSVSLSAVSTASLIDLKPIFMLSVFPCFVLFDRLFSPKIDEIAKVIIFTVLMIMTLSFIFQFNYMNIIIRGDIGLISMVALILLLPMSFKDLKRYIPLFVMLFLCFILIQGRASMLAGGIAIGFLLIQSIKAGLIERRILKYYFFLGAIFIGLISLVFFSRASDISSNFGVSAIESEARLLAFIVFYDVANSFTISEWLFGRGFGIDFSTNINCSRVLPLVCFHMENIIMGNNGIYPAIGFHNELIRILVTTGLFGLILIFIFLKSLWRKKINAISEVNKIYAIRLNSLIVLFIISTFSHGILGSTITSFVILSAMAITYSKALKKDV
tara:strand:+ start:550 stop:1725 length:1176 start_codon:yes stop_codon:yes gene_type:complete